MNEKEEIKDQGMDAFTHCLSVLAFVLIGTIIISGITIGVLYLLGVSTTLLTSIIVFLGYALINFEVVGPYFLVKQIVKPLEKLNSVSNKLARGEFDARAIYEGSITEHKYIFHNFNKMAEELASIETLRSDFVSNVSHEFKTPLAAIEGYAGLLLNTDLTENEKNEYANRIIFNTERLSSLVGNILMLNKLENQSVQHDVHTYRLDEQIRQIILLHENTWNSRGIKFDLDLQEISYTGAEQLLYHAWSNLISNAVKYSPDGGVICIYLSKMDERITFKITDCGNGIPEKSLCHIFEKFYQADHSHKSEGNGLGIAQVRKILDLVGGTIDVTSKEGKGSRFVVTVFAN